MGGIAAALAFEIDRRIAATPGRITGWRDIVFPLKTFVARPRLEQRPVHGEVLIRQQLRGVGLKQHRLEERRRDIAIEQPISILRERGRRPDAVVHPQAHEPAEQNVEVQLLHQLPLTPDAVERLQQQGPQQLLRGDRGPAELDIQHVELGRQSGQRPIGHPANRSQRMIRRHTFLRRDVAEHRSWLLIGYTYRSPPFRWEDGSTNESPRGTYFFSSLLEPWNPGTFTFVTISASREARRSRYAQEHARAGLAGRRAESLPRHRPAASDRTARRKSRRSHRRKILLRAARGLRHSRGSRSGGWSACAARSG